MCTEDSTRTSYAYLYLPGQFCDPCQHAHLPVFASIHCTEYSTPYEVRYELLLVTLLLHKVPTVPTLPYTLGSAHTPKRTLCTLGT